LVKHKDYRVVSMLYIGPQDKCSEYMRRWVIVHEGEGKDSVPTTWGADWYICGTANHIVITLCPSPCFL